MAHQKRPQNVGAAGDLVVQDALLLGELVIVAAQFIQGRDGHVGRAVGVMHRGTVDGLALLPDRQPVGDGKCLAMTHDHAVNAVVGHPGCHPGVDAHAGEANLVARAFGVLVGQRRQLLFVRAPAHFGGGGAFLAEALDAPGVDELVHLLRLIGDLGVALAAMNHLHPELHGQEVEFLLGNKLPDFVGGLAGDLAVLDHASNASSSAVARAWRSRTGPITRSRC